MLKLRFFLNEPNGKPWKSFKAMMPRLGSKYEIEIEVTSKPIADYQTDEYFELDLPVAPAVMVGDEIVVEGSGISEEKVEAVICRHLGMPEPVSRKKGFLGKLFGGWGLILQKHSSKLGSSIVTFPPKKYEEPSMFTAENLLREARRQKATPSGSVPEICLLDPDGNMVRHLVAGNQAFKWNRR